MTVLQYRSDTRQQVMEIAAQLFAERGLASVSLRDITNAAAVNLGAVNYHFGSKQALIEELYDTVLNPLLRERIEKLDLLEHGDRASQLTLEEVLRALIEPTVLMSIGHTGLVIYLPRLMAQAYAASTPFFNEALAKRNDAVARRFIDAMSRALPQLPREEICWRYYLILGGILQILSDATGLRRLFKLSDGLCNTDDVGRVTEQMITFYVAGMDAPVPGTV